MALFFFGKGTVEGEKMLDLRFLSSFSFLFFFLRDREDLDPFYSRFVSFLVALTSGRALGWQAGRVAARTGFQR